MKTKLITNAIVATRSVKLLQISDSHLFGEVDSCLLGVNTLQSFSGVLDAIKVQILNEQLDIDALVVTGDISQDESRSSYVHFINKLDSFNEALGIKSYVQSGNHDSKKQLNHALCDHQKNKQQQKLTSVQWLTQLQVNKYWQLISIETPVIGMSHGDLSNETLTALELQLQRTDSFVFIFCHHNVLDVHSQWLNQHKLKNNQQLWQILEKYPQVKGIAHGHIHQEVDVLYQNVRVLSAPATSIQFKPNSPMFQLDAQGQGWRLIQLYANGAIETQVYRLTNDLYPADLTSKGY